jgi:hypothetical protein
VAVEMMDILSLIYIVSINGLIGKEEIQQEIENMKIEDWNELTRTITEIMQEYQKKSLDSSMNTKSS